MRGKFVNPLFFAMLFDTLNARVRSTYADCDYPVGRYQCAQWARTRPLEGLTVVDATPVFLNTVSKYLSLMQAGARVVVGLSQVMPHDDTIVSWLEQSGMSVLREGQSLESVDIVLDCAASFLYLAPRIGHVELTRSGVYRYAGVTRPVFVADAGRIKRIETCLGTGESYFRAMAQLGYTDWKGRSIVIFGSGKVGTGLVTYAHKFGCHVTVVTRLADVTDSVRRLADCIIAADNQAAIMAAVQNADAVVTATGVPGALRQSCPAAVWATSHAVIANMGVEDEFGPELPAERVLEGKRPLNFILDEPTRMKYIDATMALHNAGAVWLAQHPHASGLIDPPAALEEELLEVCRRDGTIADELQYIL